MEDPSSQDRLYQLMPGDVRKNPRIAYERLVQLGVVKPGRLGEFEAVVKSTPLPDPGLVGPSPHYLVCSAVRSRGLSTDLGAEPAWRPQNDRLTRELVRRLPTSRLDRLYRRLRRRRYLHPGHESDFVDLVSKYLEIQGVRDIPRTVGLLVLDMRLKGWVSERGAELLAKDSN